MNITEDEKKAIKFEKAFINKLIKENQFPVEFTFPIGLQFELTASCNLKCKHCYNRSGDNDKITSMTPQHWIDFSRYLVDRGGIFQCILSGGEPLLLGNKLFEIMDILHNDGTGFILITNGMLVTQNIAQNLMKYRFYRVQVSIDGATAELHDNLRGVKGSFDRAVEAVLLLSNAGLPVTIANCVTRENLDSIEKMAEMSYLLGASSIIFGKIMPSGRAALNNNLFLTEQESELMLKKINSLIKKYFNKLIIQIGATDIYQLNKSSITPNSVAIIRPNGDIRLDCVAPIIAGNILKDDFYKLWNQKFKNVWTNKKVIDYLFEINNLNKNKLSVINHVDKDIEL
ncbi:MAG: radical SAM protein [Deltaproteobacteria bacterium]|jgi:MoaA/NifB/PqqE/SkfB family radical SAM enzyme|nr:radical SAM protein [Deltaproteobacteria bacterium]